MDTLLGQKTKIIIMGKFIVDGIVGLLLVVTFASQVLAPLFISDLKFFWLFRPSDKDSQTKI